MGQRSSNREPVLRHIVERATEPFERDSVRFVVGTPDARAKELLDQWKSNSCLDLDELLRRRLELQNLSPEHALALFTTPAWTAARPFPSWCQTLDEVLSFVESRVDAVREQARHYSLGSEQAEPADSSDAPIAFEELLYPWLAVARAKLSQLQRESGAWLAESAWAALEDAFLGHVSQLTETILAGRFGCYRRLHGESIEESDDQSDAAGTSRRLYLEWVAAMYEGGLQETLCEFPVLARLLAEQTDFWVERISEFVSRFQSDRTAIVHELFGDSDPGKVVGVSPFLSDLHNGGRAVISLLFASGELLIYKPRSMRMDLAWKDFVDALHAKGALPELKVPHTIARDNYGWVEFCRAEPCQSESEAKEYFRRAGALMGLVHLFQGTDFHLENLIACGPYPVLVDLETLFYPRQAKDLDAHDSEAIANLMIELDVSVLSTGLMPLYQTSDAAQPVDVGGLTARADRQPAIVHRGWQNTNTDEMGLCEREFAAPGSDNLPVVDGRQHDANAYLEPLIQGFEATMLWFIDHKQEVLEEGGLLAPFQQTETRLIPRNTQLYTELLSRSLRPSCLRDAAVRFVELECLARPLLGESGHRPLWPIVRHEVKALSRMDIPYFQVHVNSHTLTLEHEVLPDCFPDSPWQHVVATIGRLDHRHIKSQTDLIRTASYASDSRLTGQMRRSRFTELAPPKAQRLHQVLADECLSRAEQIANRFVDKCVHGEDGTATWMTPNFVTKDQPSYLRSTDLGLYDGLSGIGVFLAAASVAYGREDLVRLARGTFQSAQQVVESKIAALRLARRIGIGIGSGLSSIAYGCSVGAEILDDAQLLETAVRYAELIDDDAIRADEALDIMAGSAGVVLTCLHLYKLTGSTSLLRKATLAGDTLVAKATSVGRGGIAWQTMGELRSGFSHGAAGVVTALAKLAAATGEARFADAAARGLRFERSLFEPSLGNWKVVDPTVGKEEFELHPVAWCYGASGIGLSRLALISSEVGEVTSYQTEIQSAIDSTLTVDWSGRDHTCCGNFGRLSFLFEAASQLNREDVADQAATITRSIFDRHDRRQRFEIFEDSPSCIWMPGLFSGEAGIGYELLRMADPKRFPNVLRLSA